MKVQPAISSGLSLVPGFVSFLCCACQLCLFPCSRIHTCSLWRSVRRSGNDINVQVFSGARLLYLAQPVGDLVAGDMGH